MLAARIQNPWRIEMKPNHKPILAALLLGTAFLRCQTATPPPPTQPAPAAQAAPETSIGTVRVKATTLNVRQGPSSDDAVIATARRGQKLELLKTEKDWSRVRLTDGSIGWVSSRHVAPVVNAAGCLPPRNFSFVQTPALSFSEGGAKGTVTVEASVDPTGKVTSTRVTGNSTSDPSLGEKAAREIAAARFNPPVTDCKPRAFVYIYKRQF